MSAALPLPLYSPIPCPSPRLPLQQVGGQAGPGYGVKGCPQLWGRQLLQPPTPRTRRQQRRASRTAKGGKRSPGTVHPLWRGHKGGTRAG